MHPLSLPQTIWLQINHQIRLIFGHTTLLWQPNRFKIKVLLCTKRWDLLINKSILNMLWFNFYFNFSINIFSFMIIWESLFPTYKLNHFKLGKLWSQCTQTYTKLPGKNLVLFPLLSHQNGCFLKLVKPFQKQGTDWQVSDCVSWSSWVLWVKQIGLILPKLYFAFYINKVSFNLLNL